VLVHQHPIHLQDDALAWRSRGLSNTIPAARVTGHVPEYCDADVHADRFDCICITRATSARLDAAIARRMLRGGPFRVGGVGGGWIFLRVARMRATTSFVDSTKSRIMVHITVATTSSNSMATTPNKIKRSKPMFADPLLPPAA
jgi:hypothetical protein